MTAWRRAWTGCGALVVTITLTSWPIGIASARPARSARSHQTDVQAQASTSTPRTVSVVDGSPPSVTAIPNSIDFSQSRAGVLSTPVDVELTNNGQGDDVIAGMSFVGSDPNNFAAATDCYTPTGPGTLAPGASCQISVAFVPVGTGPSSAELAVQDNETTPLMISLSGVGTDGYYEATSKGQVLDFGDAQDFGDLAGSPLTRPIVAVAATSDGNGYWLVGSDGGVFAFGDANFFGSTGGLALNQPIVGITPTPDGGGYWLVAADGGIFAYGDAGFYGSTGNVHLNKPIVGMASTPDGRGYWLVAADGGIFAYGDAGFYGSAGNRRLTKPIVGMATTPDGHGYWLVAADGGIFAYGDAPFYGSAGNLHLDKPIVAMGSSPDGGGYWFVAADGGLFNYGDAEYEGSGVGAATSPVVGMAPSAPVSINDYLGVTPVADQPQLRARLRAASRARP